MLNLGVIGTNWISHQFVDSAIETGRYQLKAIYSRKMSTASEFAAAYPMVKAYIDITEFLADPDLDVVYIASPNSLHYQQAKQALCAGKHVIVEKPAASNRAEIADLLHCGQENECYFFEAARNIHEANFAILKQNLPPLTEITGANFTYMKYSARYDLVLAGEEPNIFSPHFSGGALMDLGIYLVYAAVALFGSPTNWHYSAEMIRTGVDGGGTALLQYPQFSVTLNIGKTSQSFLPSEIYTHETTLCINAMNTIESIQRYRRQTNALETITCQPLQAPLMAEALDFAEVMENGNHSVQQMNYQTWSRLALEVHDLMAKLRQSAGLAY